MMKTNLFCVFCKVNFYLLQTEKALLHFNFKCHLSMMYWQDTVDGISLIKKYYRRTTRSMRHERTTG